MLLNRVCTSIGDRVRGSAPTTDEIRFRPIREDTRAPDRCPLCTMELTLFAYSISQARREDFEGFCCLRCAQQLLSTMEEVALARWLTEDCGSQTPGVAEEDI